MDDCKLTTDGVGARGATKAEADGAETTNRAARERNFMMTMMMCVVY
jgi:hypothetical protein